MSRLECVYKCMLQLNFCFFVCLVLCIKIHVDGGGGDGGRVDCEQSPFFFQFSEGSARARK